MQAALSKSIKRLLLLSLIAFAILSFSSFTEDNPYDRDVSILLLTKTIEDRDAFVDLILANKEFKRVDVHALEEQKNLRFSKYELIVLPVGAEKLKERLNKYYDTGVGIFVYGGAGSQDLNKILNLPGESEDFLIMGMGEGSMAKLGKLKLAQKGAQKNYYFDIVGKYKDPGSFIRVDIEEQENYSYKLLKAIVDVHSDMKLRKFGSSTPSRLCFYSYLGDGSTVMKQFLSLYRDYAYDVQNYFRFKLISELEVRSKEGYLDELDYKVNTHEAASILEISPKISSGIRAGVSKGRDEAYYEFSSPMLLPGDLSGKVYHSSQFFLISTEDLVMTTTIEPKLYYGSFKQYELYPGNKARNSYDIEVLF